MLSGRRYLLDLSPEQGEMCEEFGDICRSVWNTALEQRREYRRRGAWMNYVPRTRCSGAPPAASSPRETARAKRSSGAKPQAADTATMPT
ncbi:helix-turn-helix domain-containing protein [Streptomyces sp. NPDC055692]|uniref:helix-turn-helix domain-containing protein n=1 Tax=Streptomyces sp. NPDC055692 TaxID=3155683 RepID=UPI00342A30F8